MTMEDVSAGGCDDASMAEDERDDFLPALPQAVLESSWCLH